MLVRTKARARVRCHPLSGRRGRRSGRRTEFDWGYAGVHKTLCIENGLAHGTFECDLHGRSLLMLPVYYPLAAAFVRIETRRHARGQSGHPQMWTSHPRPGWYGWDEPLDGDDGSGVREPRRPRPSIGGAAVRLAPPTD
jgi:hypothetical protein